MRILVIGATGGIGSQVVSQALDAGHHVTAFARSRLDQAHEHLTVLTGDATTTGSLDEAMAGQEAVVCAIGGGLGDRTVRTEATRNLLGSMTGAGAKRLVVVSALGAGDSYSRIDFVTKAICKTLLRNAMKDHNAQEALVQASATEHTILRPAGLSNEPKAPYQAVIEGPLKGKGRVPRASVAQAAMRALEGEWKGQAVAVLSAAS